MIARASAGVGKLDGAMPDEQPPLNHNEQALANISAHHVRDALLVDLLELADKNISTSIGLLLNGMIVMGELSPPRLAAGEVDAERRRLMAMAERPDDLTDEEWAERAERFATLNTTAVDHYEDDRKQLEEDLQEWASDDGIDYDTAPGDLTRRAIGTRARAFLTLRNVQIVAPGTPGTARLAVLRVAIAQIAGWWVIRLDESGAASFPLFTVDEEQGSPDRLRPT